MQWNLHSRVHLLNHFPSIGVNCYVKRDDELGCGISGSKLRKYASLVPYFLENGIRHLIIIAGPQSNNLLAALQIARELKMAVTAFLIKPWKIQEQGNFKLSQLFLDPQDIVWIERDQWCDVGKIAEEHLRTLKCPGFILDEGASVVESMNGAMTLASDIIENEREMGGSFQHILVDAGTGFTAAALIAGLAQFKHHAQVHVLLLADSEAIFIEKLQQWLGFLPTNFQCFIPTTAKAFGALNQKIKLEIRRVAREEGILVDPIYAAKLFHEGRGYIVNNQLQGNVLLIHSGGTLTMPGFDYI